MFYRHTPPTVHSPGVFVYSLDSNSTHAQKLAVLEGISLAHYVKKRHAQRTFTIVTGLKARAYTQYTQAEECPITNLFFPSSFRVSPAYNHNLIQHQSEMF